MELSEETMSKFSEHFDGYKTACENHPELKSFDSSLEQRAIKMIDTVTAGAEAGTGFLSQHKIHMEVSQHLVEVTKDVANFILESEVDVWKNIPLRSLVTAYFENTKKTLEIFRNIMECVEKAERGQHVILQAVKQFENESGEKDLGVKKRRYEKTLEELKKLKPIGDPFSGLELKTQFKLIIEQQKSLLKDVSEAKKELDKEVEKVSEEIANKPQWSFWSNVIFGAAACIAFIASVGLIVSGVGAPAGIALAGVLFLGVVPGWIGLQVFLKNRIDALKKQQEALKKLNDQLESLGRGAEIQMLFETEASESISGLVEELEKKISSLLYYVDDAIDSDGDEVDTRGDLEKIRDKVGKLTEKIMELGESVDKHSKLIRKATLQVSEKINGQGKDQDA